MKCLNVGCGGHFRRDWTNVDIRSSDPAVKAHDITRGLPFAEGVFDVVYHSHLLEHLGRDQVAPFLAECRRVLRPAGVIRVAVPDLEQIARGYLEALDQAVAGAPGAGANYEWMMLEMYDQVLRNEPGGAMQRYLSGKPIANEEFIRNRCGAEAAEMIDASARPHAWLRRLIRKIRFRRSREVHRWMYDRYSLSMLLAAAGFDKVAVRAATESYVPEWASFQLDSDANGATRKPDSLFMEAVNPP